MCTQLVDRASRTVSTYRSKHGDPAYRNKLQKLRPRTQDTLWMVEAGMSGQDIVDIIAYRDFHSDGLSLQLTKEELLAAKVELTDQFHEIRAAFEA